MTQTPRPPCSAPHRPRPRGGGELRRPCGSRRLPLPRAAPSGRPWGWVAAPRVRVGWVDPAVRPGGIPRCPSRADLSPRRPLGGKEPSPGTPLAAGIWRVRASAPGSPPRPAAGPGSQRLPPAAREPESRPPRPGLRRRGSDPRESTRSGSTRPGSTRPGSARPGSAQPGSAQPGSRRGAREPGGSVRGAPGVPESRPCGLPPGSRPYGLLGRVPPHSGSLICALDVSRCALTTGT
jgi:hypothetical protein